MCLCVISIPHKGRRTSATIEIKGRNSFWSSTKKHLPASSQCSMPWKSHSARTLAWYKQTTHSHTTPSRGLARTFLDFSSKTGLPFREASQESNMEANLPKVLYWHALQPPKSSKDPFLQNCQWRRAES